MNFSSTKSNHSTSMPRKVIMGCPSVDHAQIDFPFTFMSRYIQTLFLPCIG